MPALDQGAPSPFPTSAPVRIKLEHLVVELSEVTNVLSCLLDDPRFGIRP
jgi:hypothetical protein